MEIAGRIALVTGGGIRVGRALALALGSRGATVAVHYHRSAAEAETAVAAIEAGGGRASSVQADLIGPDAPAALVGDVVARFGGLDLLVNSAAIMERTPFGETTPEQWDRIVALNLRAPYFLTQAAGPHLRRARGAVVNIADLAAFETWPGYIPHGLAKAGVVYMTRALARVLAPDVRVNAIAPGTVLLPETFRGADAAHLAATTPLTREGTPDDVVHAMMFLLEADYVTGETIIVDGGRHVRR